MRRVNAGQNRESNITESSHNLAADHQGQNPSDDQLQYIYAYGSLLSPQLMRETCPSATFVMRANLPNYQVQFRVPSDTGLGGISGIVEAPGQLVQGVLYAVKKAEVLELDDLEGVTTGVYRKDRFLVLGEDKEWYGADIYKPAAAGDELLAPAPFYLDAMIAGAKSHRLDPKYTEKLVAWRRSLA